MRSARPKSNNQRRRSTARRSAPIEVWRPGGPLPDLEPIQVSEDVGALLRSLGDPPMHNPGVVVDHVHYVLARAADVAGALAISADLLAARRDEV